MVICQSQAQFPEFAVSLRGKEPSQVFVSHSFTFGPLRCCFFLCWCRDVVGQPLRGRTVSPWRMKWFSSSLFCSLGCCIVTQHLQPWALIHRVHTSWHWLPMMDEYTVSLLWAVVQVTVEEITIVIGFAYLPHVPFYWGTAILHSTCKSFMQERATTIQLLLISIVIICFYLDSRIFGEKNWDLETIVKVRSQSQNAGEQLSG